MTTLLIDSVPVDAEHMAGCVEAAFLTNFYNNLKVKTKTVSKEVCGVLQRVFTIVWLVLYSIFMDVSLEHSFDNSMDIFSIYSHETDASMS